MADKPLTPSQYHALSDALKAKAEDPGIVGGIVREARHLAAGFDSSGASTQALITEEASANRARGAKVYQKFLDELPAPARDSIASAKALTTSIESPNIRTDRDREMVEATAIELAAKVYSRGDIENWGRGIGGATQAGFNAWNPNAEGAVQAMDAVKRVAQYLKEADVKFGQSDLSNLAQAGRMLANERERSR